MKRALLLLAACSPPGTFVDPEPPPPRVQAINELSPITALTTLGGSIPTNAIPSLILAPSAPGITRTGGLPARTYPAQPNVPAPFNALVVSNLGGLYFSDGAFETTAGGATVTAEIEKLVVDGVVIANPKSCRIEGATARGAVLLDVDLTGRDLNEIVAVGLTAEIDHAWMAGLAASSIRCDCGGLVDVEVSACGSVSRPYDVAVELTSLAGEATFAISRAHVLLAATASDGTPSPYCSEGVPAACGAGCTAAGGKCVTNACVLEDRDQDGAPGYVAVDGASVSTLDENLRVTTAASFKVAFDPRVAATLVCANGRDFDFAGEIGVAGLFGSTAWNESQNDLVRDQQRWFSSVFMALVNVWNKRVRVSLRQADGGPTRFGSGRPWPEALRPLGRYADIDGDGLDDDLVASYSEMEGTYYGNLFVGDCASSTHPDCAFGSGSNFFNLLDYIRTTDPPVISVSSADMAMCMTQVQQSGQVFDEAKHWIPSAINATTRWCVIEPRTCATHPVIAMFFCEFETSGYAHKYCVAGTDPAMGWASCVGDGGAPDPWQQQVTVYLANDPTTRFDVDEKIACRARNRLRIAIGGCDDPGVIDCDGDLATADGCVGR